MHYALSITIKKGNLMNGRRQYYYDRASRYMIEMDWDKEDPDCDIAGEMERGALMFDGLHPN